MAQTELRRYEVEARSTDTFGRVLCACRNHHFVADGPVQNGCPGEAVTPAAQMTVRVGMRSVVSSAPDTVRPRLKRFW